MKNETSIFGLRVSKCIVSGLVPDFFTGHVVARLYVGDSITEEPNFIDIKVAAGFSNKVQVPESKLGCFGPWQPAFGIDIDDSIND